MPPGNVRLLPASASCPIALEIELCTELNRPRRLRIAAGVDGLIYRSDHSKDRWPGAKVAAGIRKVRMVEHVISFQPQLQVTGAFKPSNGSVFIYLDIGVIEPRTMKEITLHVSEGPDRLLRKRRCFEPIVARIPR